MRIKKEMKEIEKAIDNLEKDIKKDIKYTEKWMYERRKFFIKLALIVGSIVLILIILQILKAL